MRFVDASEVDSLLDYPELIAALEAGHRTGVDSAERMLLSQPNRSGTSNHFLIWPAWQHGEALGIKLVTSFPENTGPNLPTVHAIYALFDGASGAPRLLIDGTAMTPWKTAADSALGARFLARPDAGHLLMVGAGIMAPHLIRAHVTVRPGIRRVTIWNRTAERARQLADSLALESVEVVVTGDLETAVGAADLISCATASREPLIRGAWLKPGTHLDLVGSFTPEMREADDQAFRRARVHVDSRWFTLDDCGDLMAPLASGAITREDVLGDLFELASGDCPGRESAEEITLYKNAGGGHLDLMTARHIESRAASRQNT